MTAALEASAPTAAAPHRRGQSLVVHVTYQRHQGDDTVVAVKAELLHDAHELFVGEQECSALTAFTIVAEHDIVLYLLRLNCYSAGGHAPIFRVISGDLRGETAIVNLAPKYGAVQIEVGVVARALRRPRAC